MTTATRLDRVFREVKELVPIEGMELLTPSTVHGVVAQASLESRPQQAFREGYQVAPAQPDDFVISLSSHAHGIEWCGMVGGISPDYTLLRLIVDKRYSRYLKYALKSHYVIGQLGVFKTGVRMGLRLQWNKVRYCTVDLPSLPMAIALADYLDTETGRIDALVAKKARFIELLREKRQATVARAVTKGLDANAPMMNSGVDWLGMVPAHWNVSRFKHSTTSCQNGLWGSDPNGVDDIECVRVADFDRPTLSINAEIPTLRAITKRERIGRLLRLGNLLLEKSGGGESQPVGQVVLYGREGQAICSNFVAKIELAPGMDYRFWTYQHHAAYTARVNVKSIKQTSGIQNLDQHQYLDELAVFPTFEEQGEISDYLDRTTSRIDTLIAKTERSIELLREHRTALITAAVTGKIDLRSAA